MLQFERTANLPLGLFSIPFFKARKLIVRTSITVLVAVAMAGCGGAMHPPDVSPAQPGVVSQNPQSWYILYSAGTADHPQAASDAAWNLLLPNRGYLSYVQTPYRPTVRPRQIVLSYKIVESPGAIPVSYQAAASPCREHYPCTPVAEFHIFFQQRGDDLSSECGRWWYKPGFRLTDVFDASYTADPFVADGQQQTVTIPLTADLWTSVTGRGSAADFESALMNAGHVGITFGGSDFFGHGVYVKQGTVQFQMIDYRVE